MHQITVSFFCGGLPHQDLFTTTRNMFQKKQVHVVPAHSKEGRVVHNCQIGSPSECSVALAKGDGQENTTVVTIDDTLMGDTNKRSVDEREYQQNAHQITSFFSYGGLDPPKERSRPPIGNVFQKESVDVVHLDDQLAIRGNQLTSYLDTP